MIDGEQEVHGLDVGVKRRFRLRHLNIYWVLIQERLQKLVETVRGVGNVQIIQQSGEEGSGGGRNKIGHSRCSRVVMKASNHSSSLLREDRIARLRALRKRNRTMRGQGKIGKVQGGVRCTCGSWRDGECPIDM